MHLFIVGTDLTGVVWVGSRLLFLFATGLLSWILGLFAKFCGFDFVLRICCLLLGCIVCDCFVCALGFACDIDAYDSTFTLCGCVVMMLFGLRFPVRGVLAYLCCFAGLFWFVVFKIGYIIVLEFSLLL